MLLTLSTLTCLILPKRSADSYKCHSLLLHLSTKITQNRQLILINSYHSSLKFTISMKDQSSITMISMPLMSPSIATTCSRPKELLKRPNSTTLISLPSSQLLFATTLAMMDLTIGIMLSQNLQDSKCMERSVSKSNTMPVRPSN